MADEQISLSIDIEADNSQLTLGQLKKRFEDLETALESQERSTAKGKKEFDKLTRAMAQTSSEIKNVELSFEGLDTEGVASSFGGLVGSVGDVSASFILLGDDSESMQEVAKNIEFAMGMSMGLKGAIEGVSEGFKLWNNVISKSSIFLKLQAAATATYNTIVGVFSGQIKIATSLQMAWNAILSANPIGLVVVAIGALVAGILLLGGTIKGIINTVLSPFKAAIGGIKSALQALGLADSETAKVAKRAAKERIDAAREEAKARLKSIEDQIEGFDRLQNQINDHLDWEIAKRKAAGEATEDLDKQRLLAAVKIAERQVQEQRDAAKAEADVNANLDAFKRAGLESHNRFEAEARAENLRDRENNLKEAKKALILFNTEQTKIANDAAEKDREDRQKRWEERMEDDKRRAEEEAKWREDNDLNIRERKRIGASLIENDEIKEDERRINRGLMVAEALLKIEQDKFDKIRMEAEKDDARRQARLDDIQNGLDILTGLNDTFSGNEEKRAKRQRALAIAQLGVDTARSISSGIAAAAGIPFPGNLLAFLPTVATVLANMAQAKQLLGAGAGSVSLPSGGASAGGGASISPVSNASTIIDQPNTQVFVTEQDISETQGKVNVIEANATI